MRYRALLCLLLAFLLTGQVHAQAVEMEVVVNGETLTGEAEDGATYVPLAPLMEALGNWATTWDREAQAAAVETDLCTLTIPLRSREVLVGDAAYELNGPVIGRNGRTYVPLRALADLLGAEVAYVDARTPVTVTSRPPVDYTEEDLYWLSRIISAESQGECLLGQLAVGSVVMNRVASEAYPDNIKDVVFDTRDAVQFTPTANGAVYWEPTELSVLAARLVLNGASVVEDCKFFFCPALSDGTWIRENCEYHTTIGCHMFFR